MTDGPSANELADGIQNIIQEGGYDPDREQKKLDLRKRVMEKAEQRKIPLREALSALFGVRSTPSEDPSEKN